MTTLALAEPPLRRLFERLDFAPQPRHEGLAALLAHWTGKRQGVVAPRPADIDLAEAGAAGRLAFIAGRRGQRDYALIEGGSAARALLGPCEPGGNLTEAPESRAAARLRRLFDAVLAAGEPVLAEFRTARHGWESGSVEVLAAPLSSDGHRIDAVLAGVSMRPVRAAPPPTRQARGAASRSPLLFALQGSRTLGEAIADRLGLTLAALEERDFEDGEHKIRSLVSVRDRDVYVLQSLKGDGEQSANDRMLRLLFFVGALKDAAAARVTAVLPYLAFARKDRQTKARDPVTTRYVAQLFEAMGTDRVITMDVHNIAAFQNAFRCDTEHLEAAGLFVRHFAREVGPAETAVVSPDLGGIKRAEAFRERLEAQLQRPVARGFMDKQRSQGRVTGDMFAGDVSGRTVIILDDMISTGTTMARVAAACRERGATAIHLAATHGLFATGAATALQDPAITRIVVTDSVPQVDSRAILGDRLVVLPAAPLLAAAIERCHAGGSIVDLLAGADPVPPPGPRGAAAPAA